MNVSSFERIVKYFIIIVCSFYMLIEYACTDGGNFDFAEPKNLPTCSVENKKVARYLEKMKVPFLRLFINGTQGLFSTYHVYYKNASGKKIDIITYKFPFTYGLDVIMEDTRIMIKETPEVIMIYYDEEPIDGFIISDNPFSKKILLEYKSDLEELRKKGESCFI